MSEHSNCPVCRPETVKANGEWAGGLCRYHGGGGDPSVSLYRPEEDRERFFDAMDNARHYDGNSLWPAGEGEAQAWAEAIADAAGYGGDHESAAWLQEWLTARLREDADPDAP